MPKDLLTGSGRRVALVSAAAVAVIAAAVLITIWRYEAAISKWDAAQDEESDAARATATGTRDAARTWRGRFRPST